MLYLVGGHSRRRRQEFKPFAETLNNHARPVEALAELICVFINLAVSSTNVLA